MLELIRVFVYDHRSEHQERVAAKAAVADGAAVKDGTKFCRQGAFWRLAGIHGNSTYLNIVAVLDKSSQELAVPWLIFPNEDFSGCVHDAQTVSRPRQRSIR